MYSHQFHHIKAAYKLIQLQITQSSNYEYERKRIYEEYRLQKLCSKKPTEQDELLSVFWSYNYENDMEKLIAPPLCCIKITELKCKEWMVVVTRQYETDLQSLKNDRQL